VKAGSNITITFSYNQILILGFLLYAEHVDGNRYGVFDLNAGYPANISQGYLRYVNASAGQPSPCPGGNGPTITHANNICDYDHYSFVYHSDANHPGKFLFCNDF
jgi:hypothetical protein